MYERKMARKENRAIKKYNKYEEKAENASSERRRERYKQKAAVGQAKVESISRIGQDYYSLDKKERRKISRGYAVVQTLNVLTAPSLVGYGVVSYANRAHASNRTQRKARERENR